MIKIDRYGTKLEFKTATVVEIEISNLTSILEKILEKEFKLESPVVVMDQDEDIMLTDYNDDADDGEFYMQDLLKIFKKYTFYNEDVKHFKDENKFIFIIE